MEKQKHSEEELIQTLNFKSDHYHVFYIDNVSKKAECKICPKVFLFEKTSGTRSLKRHLETSHKTYFAEKERKKLAPSNQTTLAHFNYGKPGTNEICSLPFLTRSVLAICCAKHVLPLQFFEDKIIQKCFNVPYISRENLRLNIINFAADLRKKTFEEKRGSFVSLATDSWKNPVTQEKHLSVILFFDCAPNMPIFLNSHILEDGKSETIANLISTSIEFLKTFEIKVIACITDNAAICLLLQKNSMKISLQFFL